MSVSVENLSVRFGDRIAVDGVSFSVAPGECVAIVGESGSGKSVTARALVGLAGGTVRADRLAIGGADVLAAGRRQLEALRGGTVGTISQDALVALDPLRLVGREVDDALRLHTALSPVERRARVLELLASAGIPDPSVRAAQHSGDLSGGLRQRALIASALAGSPRVLIADEPTTALDRQVRDSILDLIARQVDDGIAVLLISHDLDVVARVASRVLVMKDRLIVEEGPTSHVLHAPAHPYTQRLLEASPAGKPRHTRLAPATIPPAGFDSPAPSSPAAQPSGPRWLSRPRAERVAVSKPINQESSALEARSLSLSFGIRGVLDDLSFSIPRGRTLGLVGPSGAGKTTVARIALGLQRPDAGEILLLGEQWSALPEHDRRPRRGAIGAVYQDPLGSFDPRFTVADLLADALTSGTKRRIPVARLHPLLDSVGLSPAVADRRPRTLSGGQRQRVAIARALAADPSVLVLDEPVSSLDVSIQAQILDLLDDLQRERGLSYLFISHDTDVIAHMSDDVRELG